MIAASVPVSRVLLLCMALLAGFATNTLADTAVVSFDEGTIPADLQCNETWFEGDIGLRIVPLQTERCSLDLCRFSHSGGSLVLEVAQHWADLSLIPGQVDSVEIAFSTVCFDCADISVFNGDDLVATTTNGSTFGSVTLDVGGVRADRLGVNPCVDCRICEIAVHVTSSPTSVGDGDVVTLNRRAALGAFHPNPFNPSTSVPILVSESGHAELRVYGPSGRLVRSLLESHLPAGPHLITWDGVDDEGRGLVSAVYFVQLRFDGVVSDTRKVVLLR